MTSYVPQGNALYSRIYRDDDYRTFVTKERPSKPLYIMFPALMKRTAEQFIRAFPGTPLYAVKTNPDANALRALVEGGINAFDVASLEEIRLVRAISPNAELHFMHTIKSPEDIRAAYFEYGVRNFVLDHEDELFKIIRETELAQDLNLTVRVALPKNETALIDFSSKFGAGYEDAIDLLQKCRPVSNRLGVSFHVGTQTTDAKKYADAIGYCARIIEASGQVVDSLNVGGGFPVAYQGDTNICSIKDCVKAIKQALKANGLQKLALLAEPGRVLVAQGAKLVTRVEMRKGNLLYLNDGVYGGLFDAAKWVGTHFPVSAITCDREFDGQTQSYRLAGPTCDSLDMMEGPFILPHDIGIGDWVVFDNVGAYSQTLRSDFNGFGYADVVCLHSQKET